ncbi:SDR family NAD(P)-dependent oxidoreductase [Streptomyces sp. NBC_00425]|uniref:SDR family NAD(P)-dependent oxidoreductase n=1 Tax=Streptomyces sp. NBC_00425 TaxID=2975740 RepID=UPI002E1B1DD8
MSFRESLLPDDAIAVVGTACRLPGGINDLDDLWAVLTAGRDMVTEVPADRFAAADFVDPDRRRPGHSYTAAGGFLDDVAGFDGSFFTGISAREASRMDPQQRLLLEMAVEMLDDAGVDAAGLEGSDTAVFVGCSSRDYGELQAAGADTSNPYTMSGMAGAIVANRLSHYFDWHGQSVAVDTACSSALTALHQACEHLRAGRSRAVVAGGVNVLLSPQLFAGFSSASMLSPTGRCRPFSAQADGFVRAEGGGLVLLKRLADARGDGDRIHGVIVASGANNDGRTPGLALPSSTAQQALLRDVYERAGLVPDDVAYLEAHGTGTQAGDPLEAQAIGRALGRGRNRGALPIGSIKSNLGHMEAASGMGGLFKAMLVLRHRQVPATLHAEDLSQQIDFDELNVRPVTCLEPLEHPGVALAGVNSFGFGGANAHLVLADPEPVGAPRNRGDVSRGSRDRTCEPHSDSYAGRLPVVVSARTPQALTASAERMAQHLQFTADDDFYDVAYTSTVRRGRHEHAAAVLAADPQEAADALLALAEGLVDGPGVKVTVPERPGGLAFVFSGNGSQWAGMGADLLRHEPLFAAAVSAVDAELHPALGWSVTRALQEGSTGLERTEVAQPLLFAVQVGLVALLRQHGVEPDAVVGHSVGEIAAGYAAGCLDLAQACHVVAVRSRAQGATAGSGRMAAVGLGAKEAQKELAAFGGLLELAGTNTTRDVTIAGDAAALSELGRQMELRGVFFRELDLDYAFHSRHMDSVQQQILHPLRSLRPRPGRLPLASTVTGSVMGGEQLDAEYWWRNVREPVAFADAVTALTDNGCTQFLEVGPHPVLSTYLRRLLPTLSAHATLRRDSDGPLSVRRAAASLIAVGVRPGNRCLPHPGRVVSLPAYPWERERQWNGSPDWWAHIPQDKTLIHPLLGRRAAVAEPAWHQQLSTARLPWLADHQVDGTMVMPATAYLEMALAAGRQALAAPCEVSGLDIVRPLALPRSDNPSLLVLQTSVSAEDGIVLIASRTDAAGEWTLHARACVRRLIHPAPQTHSPAAARPTGNNPGLDPDGALRIDAAVHYTHTARAGLEYGPAFQVLTDLSVNPTSVRARYQLPEAAARHWQDFQAHPVIMDGALQAAAPLLAQAAAGGMFLPTAVESLRVWQQPTAQGEILVSLQHVVGADAVVDVTVLNQDGTTAATMTGCRLHAVAPSRPLQELTPTLRAAPQVATLTETDGAVPLPSPASTVTATAAARAAIEAELADDYRHFAPRAKNAAAHWGAAAFRRLLPDATDFGLDELLHAGLRPHYAPYVALMADLAAKAGLLHPDTSQADGPRWQFTGSPADPFTHMRQFAQQHPNWITAIAVFNRCGAHLADILTGRTDPRQLLFGEADRHLVEAFYSDTPQLRIHTQFARILLQHALQDWPTHRPLRILEVGAGTGSLTAALLPALPHQLTRYTYTDLTAAFFPRAQARFIRHDNLDYRSLDLNQDPTDQGFAPGSFDLVVAANVLHATADLNATLTRLSGLLADGGQLLAVESHDEDILGPCFGLLPEYWSNTDTHLRSSPLLPREKWAPLLAGCGFDQITITGSTDEEAAGDYSVLLARRSPAHPNSPETRPAGHAQPAATGTADSTSSWLVIAPTGDRDLAAALTRTLPAADLLLVEPDVDTWSLSLDAAAASRIVVLSTTTDTGRSAAQTVTRMAGLLKTAASAATASGHSEPHLWLVTAPTGLHGTPEGPADPHAAALWGIGRVMANEHPTLTVRRLSLHTSSDTASDAARIAAEVLHPSTEDEIALNRHGRFTPRLHPLNPPTHPASDGEGYRIELRRPGRAHQLAWIADDPGRPGRGEVLVQVRAAALNYRDVMLAEGMLPPGAEPATETGPRLGLECAGTITAIGPGVTTLAVGDRVFAFGHGTLASHVRVRTEQAGHIPPGMTYEQAATLPAVYLTVQHSLETLAHLQEGDTLLVHGGAGGIGLAALNYARHVGARVIATAGSPAKRDLLRTLGATHVLNSRDLSFAAQVREATGGRGVDVVLNSLAGEAIARSLDCLTPGGRFIELGKRDIYANAPLLLRPFRNNLAYFGVDITRLIADTPEQAADAFRTVTSRVKDGTYRPLFHQSYPAPRITDAVTALRHSRHLGKVVITFNPSMPVAVEEPDNPPVLDAQATYLITGGLSGLGAATARHLAARGARHLALVSRRGATAPEAASLLADLHRLGVDAHAHALDITNAAAVEELLEKADRQGHPVRGVVHAAMHLDDAPLQDLDAERFTAVLEPKMRGAEILDRLTRDGQTDFFIVYSSVAALIGNMYQAPYAAANLHLEALMRARRDHGHPGMALAWGGISETGYVMRHRLADTIARSGIGLITPATALDALDRHLHRTTCQTVIGVMDWERLTHLLPAVTAPRFTAQMTGSSDRSSRVRAQDLRQQLKAADNDEARLNLIISTLTEVAAHVLQTSPDRINPSANLTDLGLDSLMGAELKVLMEQTFACELPLMELMAAGTINGLAQRLHLILSPAPH